MLKKIRQVWIVARNDFRSWHRNPRVIVAFLLAFILCYLLTDKAMAYAKQHETVLQLFEPFIWTFGDGNSILLSSMLLLLLFSDMPYITAGTPLYLIRTSRATWLMGQIVYTLLATFIYMAFILVSSMLLCMTNAFSGNMWSKTAAILGYSGEGQAVALPALVKTLEMSVPYRCAGVIFVLMLLYTLAMVMLMMFFTVWKSYAAGVGAAFVYTLTGFLLSPENLINIFSIPQELAFRARVWMGWISPLNHATYSMHNFGYDRLPRLWQTYVIFAAAGVVLIACSLLAVRRYNFDFRGTENT